MQIDREEIINLCCDLGIWIDLDYRGDRIEFKGTDIAAIEKLINLVATRAAEEEREKCAAICQDRYALRVEGGFPREAASARACAEEIRARGITKEQA